MYVDRVHGWYKLLELKFGTYGNEAIPVPSEACARIAKAAAARLNGETVEEEEDGGHGHSHAAGHSHDHGHSHRPDASCGCAAKEASAAMAAEPQMMTSEANAMSSENSMIMSETMMSVPTLNSFKLLTQLEKGAMSQVEDHCCDLVPSSSIM